MDTLRAKLIVSFFGAVFIATIGFATKPYLLAASAVEKNSESPRSKAARERSLDLGGGLKMEFMLIPAGSFIMGSDENTGDGDESPQHKVIFTKPFYLGKYEVTQEQWEKLMGNNPSYFKGARLPVETVSWNDCQRFLAKLREKTGRSTILPTEAQWEYACRAGTSTTWSFGASDAAMDDYAWQGRNAQGTSHPVGEKKPNAWGLYDLHGNVGEWCADWYLKHGYANEEVKDPHGPETIANGSRVIRGGAWGDSPDLLRSALRNCNGPKEATYGIGFRCVLEVEEGKP